MELAIVPAFQTAFVPIIQEDEKPFSMFKDLAAGFGGDKERMLPFLKYPSPEILIQALQKAVIEPAQRRAEDLKAHKNAPLQVRDARSYIASTLSSSGT